VHLPQVPGAADRASAAVTGGSAMVELRDVTFRYAGTPQPALRRVSIRVEAGEFCLVVGPSGGGKSTFAQLLNGAIPHIQPGELTGDVLVGGLNTRAVEMHELATFAGAVFQEPEAQLINILVRDELYFGPENLLVEPQVIRERARRALELVDMTEYFDSEIFELSGGQKQKVALAAVLTMEPRLLVLDQPTANLDPISAREMFSLLQRLRQQLGLTVVIIEHNIDELAPLVDRVAVFDRGHLVAFDGPRAVFHGHLAGQTRLGLWTPQAVQLARALEGQVTFPEAVLTEPELERVLQAELATGRAVLASPPPPLLPPLATEWLIDVRGLTYTYASNGVQALTDVELRIAAGEFAALIGRNGSGKSTLAKILTKILDTCRGMVLVDGQDINDLNLFKLTDIIGYVFQNPDHQFVTDTVFDEVAYSLRVRGVGEAEVRHRVGDVLELFQLQAYESRSPFSLSVGQRRLLSVATMLVLDQRLLILDEPTIGQDQASANALMMHLQQLNRLGKTILIITHDMRLLAEWSQRAIVMARSRLVFDGPISEVFAQPLILHAAALYAPPVVSLSRRLLHLAEGVPAPILTPAEFTAAWRPSGARLGDLACS
jgi:energy-coupling factor transport system ATP-binding protein